MQPERWGDTSGIILGSVRTMKMLGHQEIQGCLGSVSALLQGKPQGTTPNIARCGRALLKFQIHGLFPSSRRSKHPNSRSPKLSIWERIWAQSKQSIDSWIAPNRLIKQTRKLKNNCKLETRNYPQKEEVNIYAAQQRFRFFSASRFFLRSKLSLTT